MGIVCSDVGNLRQPMLAVHQLFWEIQIQDHLALITDRGITN